jgi:hypothetical protein
MRALLTQLVLAARRTGLCHLSALVVGRDYIIRRLPAD